jgi:hypothetical protein
MKDKTYDAAKAFLHLYVQRRCVDEREVFKIKGLGYVGYSVGEWSNELEDTLWMIDHIVEATTLYFRHCPMRTPRCQHRTYLGLAIFFCIIYGHQTWIA